MVLKEELHNGYLTDREYHDYVRLFQFTVDRVLCRHSQMREEVYRMTKPLLILPSMLLDELQAEIADRKAEIADQKAEIADRKAEIADQQALITDQKTQLADKDAEIRRLRHLVNELSAGDHMP